MIEGTVTIDRPPELVFDYLADMELAPDWMGGGLANVTKISPGPPRLGVRFRWTRAGARHIQGVWEWQQFERPVLLQFSGRRLKTGPLGSVEGWGEYQLQPEGSGTILKAKLNPQFYGPIKMLERRSLESMHKGYQGQLTRLKQRIELLYPPPGEPVPAPAADA